MSTGACQILQKWCNFEGYDMNAATFLENPSNLVTNLCKCMSYSNSTVFDPPR